MGLNQGGMWLKNKLTKSGQPYFTGKINGKQFTMFVNQENVFTLDGGFAIRLTDTKKPLFTFFEFGASQGGATQTNATTGIVEAYKQEYQSDNPQTMDIPF